MNNRTTITALAAAASLVVGAVVVASSDHATELTSSAAPPTSPASPPPTTTIGPAKTPAAPTPQAQPAVSTNPPPTDPDVPDAPVTVSVAGDFRIEVGPDVVPAVEEIEGFADGEPARSVGRIEVDGEAMDVVLGEFVVSATDDDQLTALLARWDAVLVDTMPADPGDETQEHLVRIDPSLADPATSAATLAALEPHDGTMRVSGEPVMRLIDAVASEANDHGTTVAFNPLVESLGVEDGTAREASDRTDPFTWSFLVGGGIQDYAVAPAWQLLHAHGKLDRSVDILINDGGFNSNLDFPDDVTLRLADWGEESRGTCGGGNDCPYHGTGVTMTAAGQLDNEYGTVGPAGPVVDDLVLVQMHREMYKILRKLHEMVDQYNPDVVNLSYAQTIKAARSSTESIMNKRYRKMYNRGALIVAGAGNEGLDMDQRKCVGNSCYERRLILPCESEYVMCVGGIDRNSRRRDVDSNFGAEDNRRSVEIWGPFDVIGINRPDSPYLDFSTGWVSGTSHSTPFVAGIAALVKAADPTLSNDEVRETLKRTANTGVQDAWITGSQRRVDALAAVADALGVATGAPTVEITGPGDGGEYLVSNWLQLKGAATDFRGEAVPIEWTSSLDGVLGDQLGVVSLGELSVGTHVLTARATDMIGQTGSDEITFDVVRRPVELTLASPSPGAAYFEDDEILLTSGTSDPDEGWQSLGEDQIEWQVRRGDDVVFTVTGHDSAIPANSLGAGTFDVRVTASAHGSSVTRSVSIEILALPPGVTRPEPRIHTPLEGARYQSSGTHVVFEVIGSAWDDEDGVLAGTRFRWTASREDTTLVLCTGSAFTPGHEPQPADEGLSASQDFAIAEPVDGPAFAVQQDCSSFDAEIPVTGPGDATWQLNLEAVDHDGWAKTVSIRVDAGPTPVG